MSVFCAVEGYVHAWQSQQVRGNAATADPVARVFILCSAQPNAPVCARVLAIALPHRFKRCYWPLHRRFGKILTGQFQGNTTEKIAQLIPFAQLAVLSWMKGSAKKGASLWLLMLGATSNLFLWGNFLTGPHFNDGTMGAGGGGRGGYWCETWCTGLDL